jgi:hypothetical protein
VRQNDIGNIDFGRWSRCLLGHMDSFTSLGRTQAHGFWLFVYSFFALQGEKRIYNKRKSTIRVSARLILDPVLHRARFLRTSPTVKLIAAKRNLV